MKNKLKCLLVLIVGLLVMPFVSYAQADISVPASSASDSVLLQDEAVVTTHKGKVTRVHTTDSVLQKKHSPKIATSLSAVLPGAGQIYNKRWWKVPIIYAGLGASSYCIYHYATKMKTYRTEYRYRMQGETSMLNPDMSYYSDENVLSLKKKYQRSMELAIAATAIIYTLNIVDAAVDAHLFYFDISNDLSLQFAPYFEPKNMLLPTHGGVSFALRWK